jgi:predicted amidohydrolase
LNVTAPIRIAALQMRSGTEPGANLAALAAMVAAAKADGALYVLSPEMTVAFAENRDGLIDVASPEAAAADQARVAAIARDNGIYLHLGSMAVGLPDGRFANRSLLFGPDGNLLAQYDKIHLFDATLPGLKHYRESATYAGGNAAVVAPVAGFTLGMTVCYDLRFASLFTTLAAAGASLIAVPAAFTVPTGEAHWEVLLRARAIETGCFIIAAGQGGTHANGRATYGHSMIVDPWGKVLARADGDVPGIVAADISLDAVAEARACVPALANARPFSLSVNLSRAV